ncbi:MAG: hypothetical protein M3P18_04970 [Actinomycetota bacterium]|nr:hypothetical protein [Actinomycetota bacterium]
MARGFGELKAEVNETFDQVLSDLTTALASVPLFGAVPIPLPGLEAESVPEPVVEAEAPPSPSAPATSSNQEKLNLWAGIEGDEPGEREDDLIAAFAPEPDINWGPRGLRLTRRENGRGPESSEDG